MVNLRGHRIANKKKEKSPVRHHLAVSLLRLEARSEVAFIERNIDQTDVQKF